MMLQSVLRRVGRRVLNTLLAKGHHAVVLPVLRGLLAVRPLRMLVGLDSRQSQTREVLGRVLAHLGRFQEAIAVFQEILVSEPRNTDALLALANCLSHAGDRKAALDVLERLLAIDPGNMQALSMKGQIHSVDGASANAIESFVNALQINPGNAAVWRMLGRLMLENDTTPASGTDKAFNRDRPWEAYKPAVLYDQLRRAHESCAGQLSQLRTSIAELRSSNLELAKLIVIQESQMGFLESYRIHLVYSHTQQYMRNLALFMQRFGEEPSYPKALAEMPEGLMSGFTMNGRVPVEQVYLNGVYPDRYADVSADVDVHVFSQMITQQLGCQPSPSFPPASAIPNPLATQSYTAIYGQTDAWFLRALEKDAVSNLRIAVYGSVNLFHETLCLMTGARPTTIRRRPIINRTQHLASMTTAEWEADPVSFDAAVAISCLEHEGLGMLGEPLDPDADLKAMERLKRIVNPGGLLFVAVPIGLDRVMFNSTRIYGHIRLPALFAGWSEIARYGCEDDLFESNGETQPVFVLRNQ
jgi:tetratricopeptide (TPR) repeat protein